MSASILEQADKVRSSDRVAVLLDARFLPGPNLSVLAQAHVVSIRNIVLAAIGLEHGNGLGITNVATLRVGRIGVGVGGSS